MLVPGSANPLLLRTAAATGYQVSRSLRFNSSDSGFCSRTFTSSGNRKTWTWAAWVKRSALAASTQYTLFGNNGNSNATFGLIAFFNDNIIVGGFTLNYLVTSAVYRDPGAWMHIVVAMDTTQATVSNRLRIYVNGSEVTVFSTDNRSSITQDSDQGINQAVSHAIGRQDTGSGSSYFSGYLADIHFIDGQALTPSSFTEVSATTGQLVPKAYTGTFGTNGFWLKFSDNSAATATTLGKDYSPNGNNWTPNNLAVVGGSTVWDLKADGTNWTNIANAFDGSTSTFADGTYNNGTTSRIRFNTPLTGVTKIRLYWGGTSTYGYNNTTVGTGPASSTPGWVTAYSGSAITVDSVIGVTQPGDGVVRLYAIEINDSVITGYSRSNPAGNDSLVDTPTSYGTDTGAGGEVRGNYCTLNPLDNGGLTLANGNLDASRTTASWVTCRSTIGISSGKWYFEATGGGTGGSLDLSIGVCKANATLSSYVGSDANGWAYLGNTGLKYTNGSSASYGAAYNTNGDIVGVAFDADNGTLTFYKNGVSQGQAYSGLTSGPYFFAISIYGSTSFVCNFGQRAFAYQTAGSNRPTSDYKALVDTNLPAPVVAKPNTVMDVLLWSGTGGNRSFSSLNMSPDFVWIKQRNAAFSTGHQLYDSVRGAGSEKELNSSGTGAEGAGNIDQYGWLSSFDSNGFSVTAGPSGADYVNASGFNYVAWTWDAGSSTVTNTQGSITSSVRANASAGFSIVTYTGNGTGGATVGHGGLVNLANGMIIIKRRNSAVNWFVGHGSQGWTKVFEGLNTTAAISTTSAAWNNTSPTSTVFTLGTETSMNGNGGTFVAYCFAPVAGYSAFGSYTGNGSATDGPFVYTGFRPRWVLVKASSSVNFGSWRVHDTARDLYNVCGYQIVVNSSGAENNPAASGTVMDILSNGFKLRQDFDGFNGSGATYIYAAFAESPFQYARAR